MTWYNFFVRVREGFASSIILYCIQAELVQKYRILKMSKVWIVAQRFLSQYNLLSFQIMVEEKIDYFCESKNILNIVYWNRFKKKGVLFTWSMISPLLNLLL